MVWAVVILGLIGLAVLSPGFRRAALVLLGATLVVAILAFAWLVHDAREDERQNQLARHRMSQSEIELSDLVLTADKLEGRLRNKSPRYTLRSVELKITLQDCALTSCEIIGEHSETIAPNIPPGQARDFSEYIWWRNQVHPRGEFRWSYEVEQIDAREPIQSP